MTKDMCIRILRVTQTVVEQANVVHAADFSYIERSRRWIAGQKKMLDAISETQAILSADSRAFRN